MKKLFNFYTVSLLLSPFIGYFTFMISGMNAQQIILYFTLLIFIFFVVIFKPKLYIPNFFWFYVLYIIYIFVWNLFNGYFENKGVVKFFFNNYHLYILFALIIIYNITVNEKSIKIFIRIMQLVLVSSFIVILIQISKPEFFVNLIQWSSSDLITKSFYLSRRPSIFTWFNDTDYGITPIAYLSLLITYKSIKTDRKFLFIILIGLYTILTNTRYVMIGYLIVIFPILFGGNKKLKNAMITILAASTLYVLLIMVFNFDFFSFYNERLFAEKDVRGTTRYLAYELFLRFYGNSPWVGTGVHLTSEIQYAARSGGSSQVHVGYLSHLISYGLIGSVLLFGFWIGLLLDIYKKAKISKNFGPFLGVFIYMISQLFHVDYLLYYPGVIISIIFSNYYFFNQNDGIKIQESQGYNA